MKTPTASLTLKKLLYRSVIVPGKLIVAVTQESNGYAVWLFEKGERPNLKKYEFDSTPAMDYAVNFAQIQRSLIGAEHA
jgi:hypothetical protein